MKGQGLPITTIIIAALGILVLVVIGAIFGGQIGIFGRAAKECPGKCMKTSFPSDAVNPESFFVQGSGCDPDFETSLSGTWIPKSTPKSADIAAWKCNQCCVATG